MPVLCISEIFLDLAVVGCKVIGNHVNNNFNAVFVRLSTKRCQSLLVAGGVVSKVKTQRLVKLPPGTGLSNRLNR